MRGVGKETSGSKGTEDKRLCPARHGHGTRARFRPMRILTFRRARRFLPGAGLFTIGGHARI